MTAKRVASAHKPTVDDFEAVVRREYPKLAQRADQIARQRNAAEPDKWTAREVLGVALRLGINDMEFRPEAAHG